VLIDLHVDRAEQAAPTLCTRCLASLRLSADIGRKMIFATWPAAVSDPAFPSACACHALILPSRSRNSRCRAVVDCGPWISRTRRS
jgi:hypothetical protein